MTNKAPDAVGDRQDCRAWPGIGAPLLPAVGAKRQTMAVIARQFDAPHCEQTVRTPALDFAKTGDRIVIGQ